MKFQPDSPQGLHVIQRATHASVQVNGQTYTSSLIVPSQGDIQAWPVTSVENLRAEDLQPLLDLHAELVILGSGKRLRFPHPGVFKALMAARIGYETMDTVAACRTYNVLMSEGRRVVAALLLEA